MPRKKGEAKKGNHSGTIKGHNPSTSSNDYLEKGKEPGSFYKEKEEGKGLKRHKEKKLLAGNSELGGVKL